MTYTHPFNKVTITIEWRPDKWMGHESWMEDVDLVDIVIRRLGLDHGRSSMTQRREWVGMEE